MLVQFKNTLRVDLKKKKALIPTLLRKMCASEARSLLWRTPWELSSDFELAFKNYTVIPLN